MGTNGTKRGDLGVHGGQNVLLWYYQIIKKKEVRDKHRLVLFYLEGNMQVIEKELSWLKPYANNPRDNESAVEPVAKSIKEFGFKVPIVATSDGEIINGHTRFKASKLLGLEKVPVIIADDLTDEQIKAFRLADNKTGEIADWNESLLIKELEELDDLDYDMGQFGFELDLDDADEDGSDEDGSDDMGDIPDNITVAEAFALNVIVKDEAEQAELYEELLGRGYEVKVVAL